MRTRILFAVTLVLVIAGVAWLLSAAPRTSPPDLTSSAGATSSAPPSPVVASPVAVASEAPIDPCHRAGVTYCALNPSVTQATIRSTICVSGWTATVRPPTSYTEPLKLQQMLSEGLTGPASGYEEDHRLPLELGGAPRDEMNLSPESHASSSAKDAAENDARRQVCAGADLRTVQAAFVATWLGAYPQYAR
jgi:hypothetical protein